MNSEPDGQIRNRPLNLIVLLGQRLSLIAAGMYGLWALLYLVGNLTRILNAEINGFKATNTLLSAPGAVVGVVLIELLVFLVLIAICILSILYGFFIFQRWARRIERQWVKVTNCNWLQSAKAFWACLKGAFWTLVETVVWILISVVAVIFVIINVVGLVIAIFIALGAVI